MPDKPWSVPTAAVVKERWGYVVDDMLDIRRNYLFNTSFFHGDQWVQWSDSAATVNLIDPISPQEAAARSTVNKIKPRTTSLLARLCKTPLAFEPRPEGVDSYALQRARLQSQILEVKAHRDGWPYTRRSVVFHMLCGGVSGISVEPDYVYEDDPVTDMLSGDQVKIPSRPATVLSALSPIEFGLEPGSRVTGDANWWIRNTTLTPAQCKARYQMPNEPAPDSESAQSAMHRLLRTHRRGSTSAKTVMVLVYYERPTDTSPGCVLHVVGDMIVQQNDWPFPFKELNLTTFVEQEIGGTWKGDTRLNDARQLQIQINKAFTSINANIGRTDNARLLVPEGSVLDGEDDFTGTAGEVVRFNGEHGAPSWLIPPDVSARGMRDHIEKLEAELDDLFNTHAVTRGEAPGDRNSGLALSILAEKDETPLGLIAEDQQRGWERVAEQVLMLERQLMETVDAQTAPMGGAPMQVTDVLISGQGGQPGQEPKEVTWTAADLPEHPVVHVPLEAVMPRSQAAVQDMFLRLAQQFPQMFASFGPSQIASVLQLPDVAAFTQTADPHVTEAQWENARMIGGADEQVVMIQPWQPHAIHLNEHNKERASSGYRQATPEVRQFMDIHCDAHERLLIEEQQQEQAQQIQQQMAMQAASAPPPDKGKPNE